MNKLIKHKELVTNLMFVFGLVFFIPLSFNQFNKILPQSSNKNNSYINSNSSNPFELASGEDYQSNQFSKNPLNTKKHSVQLIKMDSNNVFSPSINTKAEGLKVNFYDGLFSLKKPLINTILKVASPISKSLFIQ